ncbi:hypothetical protein BCR42DRAFT_478504 [Absidia repens]|uniref:Granulins domain-containing protein n=1 Tax=Absidia repens TaxID=90262 RepID=A0A1X2ILK9_9FUNG|nr:hypothetical protein BCR42DRAFT_478504 [Absidia repens]
MSNVFFFYLVAVFSIIGLIHAESAKVSPIAVIQGEKILQAHRVPKAHNFCHAGYGVCPDSHCCPMGGECCDTPGTCCPRDYRCVTGPHGREGCCPNGQECDFGDYY